MLIFLRVTGLAHASLPDRGNADAFFVEVDINAQVETLDRLLRARFELYTPRHMLFAGRKLQLHQTFAWYKVEKESTIQVVGSCGGPPPVEQLQLRAQAADGLAPEDEAGDDLSQPLLKRQVTLPDVAFGDVLLVKLVAAGRLEETNYLLGTCDPYLVLGFRQQSARSSVKAKVLREAEWGETFGFHVAPDQGQQRGVLGDGHGEDEDEEEEDDDDEAKLDDDEDGGGRVKRQPDHVLSLVIFGNMETMDDVCLGEVDIDLRDIVRDAPMTKTFVTPVTRATVTVQLERYALTSAELRDKLVELVALGRSFASRVLRAHGVHLDHFRGKRPFVVGEEASTPHRVLSEASERSAPVDALAQFVTESSGSTPVVEAVDRILPAPSNPALRHLFNLLTSGGSSVLRDLHAANRPTLEKISTILVSQGVGLTKDHPSRRLLILGADLSGDESPVGDLYLALQHVSGGNVKSLRVFPSAAVKSREFVHSKRKKRGRSKKAADNDEPVVECGTSSAIAVCFSTAEAALMTLLRMQQCPFKGKLLQVVFGDERPFFPGKRTSLTRPNTARVGLLRVAKAKPNDGPNEAHEYETCFVVVTLDSRILVFPRTSANRPDHTFSILNAGVSVVQKDAWTFVVRHESRGEAFLFRSLDDEDVFEWFAACSAVQNFSSASRLMRGSGGKNKKEAPKRKKKRRRRGKKKQEEAPQQEAQPQEAQPPPPPTPKPNNQVYMFSWPTNEEQTRMRGLFWCCGCKHVRPSEAVFQLDKVESSCSPAEDERALLGVESCRYCLQAGLEGFHERVAEALKEEPVGDVPEGLLRYTMLDLYDLVNRSDFDLYSTYLTQRHLQQAVEQDGPLLRCVKCDEVYEMIDSHTRTSREQNRTGQLGLNKRPLSAQATDHWLAHRVLCRSCRATFCRQCKVEPYHVGFTCDEYQEYLKAPLCRFCAIPTLEGLNRWAEPTAPAFESLCDDPACIDKTEHACTLQLECGHYCYGTAGDPCPPCLASGCAAATAGQNESDLCVVCSDTLSAAPCVQLGSCGHIFHAACLKRHLELGKLGRVQLKALQCMLCNARVECDASIVAPEMAELLDLEREIVAQVQERIKVENLEQDDKVQDEASPYHNDALRLGMDVYAFYFCFHCHTPYFGGRRECDQQDRRDPAEFVCSDCVGGYGECVCNNPEHKDFIVWKCRFCCSPATWLCWGTHHFDEACHSDRPFARRDGKVERTPCPPPGHDKCPLGLPPGRHKNGPEPECELALYCGACNATAEQGDAAPSGGAGGDGDGADDDEGAN